MRREEYVLIVGRDRDTPTMGEQSKRFTRAALLAGFLGLTMCVALASLAFKNTDSAAELLGMKGYGADHGLALELVKMAPTASVPQLLEVMNKAFNHYNFNAANTQALYEDSERGFQSLADTGKLCAKRDIIIQKFDQLLARLITSQKLLDDTLARLLKEYNAAKDAWLSADSECIMLKEKAVEARKGANLAKDRYVKWKDTVTLAYGNLINIEKTYNDDYDDILNERALIVEIMRLIGVLEGLPLEIRDKSKDVVVDSKCGVGEAIAGVVNGVKLAMDGAPFPLPCKIEVKPITQTISEAVNKLVNSLPKIELPKISLPPLPSFKLFADQPEKNEAIRTRLAQMYEKSTAVSGEFQGQLQKLTQSLAESAETRDVKIILNKLLEELLDRANSLQNSYTQAKKDLDDAKIKEKDYETILVKLSEEADKAEASSAAACMKKDKLAAAHIAAKEKYENEKAQAYVDTPDMKQQIKIIKLIKKKLNNYCATPGFCSNWYWNPLGSQEISTFPDLTNLRPQKAVSISKIEFVKDSDFLAATGGINVERVAMTVRGTLEVKAPGKYTVCTESDDGSHVQLDGSDIAAAPGVHGPLKTCGDRDLEEGDHEIYAKFFENGGGQFFKVTYKGPDTNNNEVLLPSIGYNGDCVAKRAECDCGKGWCAKLYLDPNGPEEVKDFINYDGRNPQTAIRTDVVQMTSDDQLTGFFKGAITGSFDHVVVRFAGVLRVSKEGDYSVCTNSDDGSRMFVDGVDMALDNGGLHAMQKKCKTTKLTTGDHVVKVDFFENGGGASIEILYSGPDTNGKEVAMPSAWHNTNQCGAPPAA